jgi:hypothetical protein
MSTSPASPMDDKIEGSSSAIKRSPTSPPASPSPGKRPKLDVSLEQLRDKMGVRSKICAWELRISGDDDSKWQVLADVFCDLTTVLATSGLKGSVIPPVSKNEAEDIVRGFTGEEFNEWKDGVNKGVREGDWGELIKHRMFHYTFGGPMAFYHSNSEAQEPEQ